MPQGVGTYETAIIAATKVCEAKRGESEFTSATLISGNVRDSVGTRVTERGTAELEGVWLTGVESPVTATMHVAMQRPR